MTDQLAVTILEEIKEHRKESTERYNTLDARVKILERKSDLRTAVISAVVYAVPTLLAAIAGCVK